MTDKTNELKDLIETLAEDSPLRKQLQDALNAELERMAQEAEKTAEQAAAQEAEKTAAEGDDSGPSLDDLKKLNEKLEGMLKEMEESNPSTITGKLEKLMEDDEFITASAGFVLGAAVAGLGALAVSLLKKKSS